jgi:aminoglycoside 3-N-acetyltransferase
VVIHSSLRSFGHVLGGAQAVVDSFIDRGSTAIVPTFSYECQVDTPPGVRLERNADPPEMQDSRTPIGFSPEMSFVSKEMGAIPAWVAGTPERRRGNHPLNSFAALGPDANSVIDGQSPFKVYSPIEAVADLGGAVALLGVGLTSLTLIHLAEENSGRALLVRWARLASGRVVPVRTGSCSRGFEKFADLLSPAETAIDVGPSHWRVFDAALALDLATRAILRNQQITVCDDPTCARCAAMVAGGPVRTAALF